MYLLEQWQKSPLLLKLSLYELATVLRVYGLVLNNCAFAWQTLTSIDHLHAVMLFISCLTINVYHKQASYCNINITLHTIPFYECKLIYKWWVLTGFAWSMIKSVTYPAPYHVTVELLKECKIVTKAKGVDTNDILGSEIPTLTSTITMAAINSFLPLQDSSSARKAY